MTVGWYTYYMITHADIKVPLDVPEEFRQTYIDNYLSITKSTGRLMLFSGDQKVEHLNDDFYGETIAKEDSDPIHMFNIASKARIGAFATQLGLIARYGMDFKDVPYFIKLNSKTHLVKIEQAEPISRDLVDPYQVIEFKKTSGLNIVGMGYTVYVGSELEHEMLRGAALMSYQAHQQGLLSIIWAYPRGKAVKDEKDPHIIAGSAGVAACLGADFVKVNYPKSKNISSAEALKEAVAAAGRTKVLTAGGSATDVKKFLQDLHDQINISGAVGNATGRNIHQRPLEEAVRFCSAVYAITVEGKSVEEALEIYESKSS